MLLLDLSFPWGQDGVTFLHSLRTHSPIASTVNLPIIILTTSEQIYQQLSEQGEVVEKKPFHITHLLTCVEMLLAGSIPDNEHAI